MPSDRERWDARHEAALGSEAARRAPASWLVRNEALLDAQPRGPALDVACGLGRNAMYLARLGFCVDAVDLSAVAVEHVTRDASAESLPVRAHRADLAVDPLPGTDYHVTVVTYFLERRLFAALEDTLAPGGLLFFETFLPDPTATYGPHDPSRVLQPGELQDAFGSLELVAYREGRWDGDSRPVASLVARRSHKQ